MDYINKLPRMLEGKKESEMGAFVSLAPSLQAHFSLVEFD